VTAHHLAEADYTTLGEAITPNLHRHYLFDGLMMVLTMQDFGRAATSVWFDLVAAHIKAATPSRPFLCVHDFNTTKAALTPYNGKKAIELYLLVRQQKGFHGRAAYVMPNSPTGQLMRLFIRGYGIPGLHELTPNSRRAGIDWCVKGLPASPTQPPSTDDTPKV
jgi:hypothetical protein